MAVGAVVPGVAWVLRLLDSVVDAVVAVAFSVAAVGADAVVVSVPYAVVAGRDALPRLRRGVDRLLSQEVPRAGLADATPAPVRF